MLYDPKWEAPVKADPFSLESLIAWLEKQPGERAYDWTGTNCVGCQYLKAVGLEPTKNYANFDIDLRVEVFHDGNWTFGAALTRARAALADR